MEKWVSPPQDAYEFVLNTPWPLKWGYRLLFLVTLLGVLSRPGRLKGPAWLLSLPLVWLSWQCIAATQTVDASLTTSVLSYFLACVVCFYLGAFVLSRYEQLWPLWLPLLVGFALVLSAGWAQRFGGLEATRHYFWTYIYPQMKEVPPEYLKKITSNRIFSTVFYPNALAGALLLLLPPLLIVIARMRAWLTPGARSFVIAALGIASLACLYWSGSKGGWLLMLFLAVLAMLKMPVNARLKLAVAVFVALAGVGGFALKHAGFFQGGATSVAARFDYWQSALQIFSSNPVVGTGPGTFGVVYNRVKRPEAEATRLVHNDYLEQASDSGLLGFLSYTGLIGIGLAWAMPKRRPAPSGSVEAVDDWQPYAVWLGLLGWGLQSFFEFSLYIPALAWTAFTLLGWLIGRKARTGNGIDNTGRPR